MRQTLDVTGHLCPVPMIRAGKLLERMNAGEELVVLSDDPTVIEDMQSYCRANGYRYLGHENRDGIIAVLLAVGKE